MMRSLRHFIVPLSYLRQSTRKRMMNPILESLYHPTEWPAFSFLANISNTTASTFCTSSGGNDDPPEDGFVGTDQECDEEGEHGVQVVIRDSDMLRDVETIVGIFRDPGRSICEAKSSLGEVCDVKVTKEVVCEVLSRLRNSCEAAYTFFLWAGKHPGYERSVRECHSMIAILGKTRRFHTAWGIIDEMRGIRTGRNLITHQTLLIMIRKYCAAHDVGKAINTFYAYKKFKLEVGLAEFQTFLSALCWYKNVEEAEHLMFANQDVYPIDTKSFNIVLNGWCNVVGNICEGNRIWLLMKERKIKGDSYSYTIFMSSFSKRNKIKVVLKLFDEMKELGVEPDRKVYNAVIHALARGNCLREARHLMETMEAKGVSPNNVTYNSLMFPLCKKYQLDTAKEFFNEMIERGIHPTVRTYHALFRCLKTEEEVFELLQRMYSTSCYPTHETYIMLIGKFCRWRKIDTVYKLWNEMSKNGLDPDRSSYNVLIEGLFLNSELAEAHQYYREMIKKHLQPEPKVEEMMQAYMASYPEA